MTSIDDTRIRDCALDDPAAASRTRHSWPSLMDFSDGVGRELIALAADDLVRTVQVDIHISRVCAGIRRTGAQVTYFSLNHYLHGLLDMAWTNGWLPEGLDPAVPHPCGPEARAADPDRVEWAALRLTAVCRLATDPKAMPVPVTVAFNLGDLFLEP
jgi:hypothetical protein